MGCSGLGSPTSLCEEEEDNNWPKITRHSLGVGRNAEAAQRMFFVMCPSLWLPAMPCGCGRVSPVAGKLRQEGATSSISGDLANIKGKLLL